MDGVELACFMAAGRVSVRSMQVAHYEGARTMYYASIRGHGLGNKVEGVVLFPTPEGAWEYGKQKMALFKKRAGIEPVVEKGRWRL